MKTVEIERTNTQYKVSINQELNRISDIRIFNSIDHRVVVFFYLQIT